MSLHQFNEKAELSAKGGSDFDFGYSATPNSQDTHKWLSNERSAATKAGFENQNSSISNAVSFSKKSEDLFAGLQTVSPDIIIPTRRVQKLQLLRLPMNVYEKGHVLTENLIATSRGARRECALGTNFLPVPAQPAGDANYRFNIGSSVGATRPVLTGSVPTTPSCSTPFSAAGNPAHRAVESSTYLKGHTLHQDATKSRKPLCSGSKLPEVIEMLLREPKQIFERASKKCSCLVLQQATEQLDPSQHVDTIRRLVDSVLPCFTTLSCDMYANFFVQLLVKKLDEHSKLRLLREVPGLVAALSTHKVGIFTIQKLLEQLTLPGEREEFFEQLIRSDCVSLAMKPLPLFMFKKMLQDFGPLYANRLLDVIRPVFLTVASDKHGICVIKLMLSTLEGTPRGFSLLLKEFLDNIAKGRSNSHFNFGIQHILQSAYSQAYYPESLNMLIENYLNVSQGRQRFRSRAIAETVLLLLQHPRREVLKNSIIPGLTRCWAGPATEQELQMLEEISRARPALATEVSVLMRLFTHH